jgi:hypothetical protein
VNSDRIDVRREPLVVRDGCAPERIPAGRWPSDDPLVRSEQFAVNEAIACLAPSGRGSARGSARGGADGGSGVGQAGNAQDDGDPRDGVFGVHAPPGTGVAEVFGDLVAAIVTERARRIADLPDPAAAFAPPLTWGVHTVAAPSAELAGFEIVLSASGESAPGALGPLAPGLALPPIGAHWRDRAARADYFASTARLSDGVGAWAMLAARLGDSAANRAFAERWWHGTVRGTDVLFPAGESMTAALRQLKGKAVDWPAAVAWFRSALAKAESLATERMRVAAALTCLSDLELACEEAYGQAEAAQVGLAELTAREPAARDAVTAAEEEYRASLAALGAHQLARPMVNTVTPQGLAALHSRGALSVALAGGVRRGRNLRDWAVARRALRAACAVAEQRWDEALRAASALRDAATAARSAAEAATAEVARLAAEMAPLAEAVTAARQRWGDHVPAGPSQAETEDPALIEWRETMAPWADEEYANARAQVFVAALELHKALIAARPEVFEANLAALMELISADPGPPSADRVPVSADQAPGGAAGVVATDGDAPDGDGTAHDAVLLAAWRSFFLVVPVVRVPFAAAGSLFDGLGPGALGWLLASAADQLPAGDVPGVTRRFDRAVLAGVTAAENSRYGTWLPAGPPDEAAPRWIGMPLRVVRGQDRSTVDERNDLAYDGLLIAGRD